MTKEETLMLMNWIKDFYPRFENSPSVQNAWHNMLESCDYEQAKKNLFEYVAGDEKGITPTIARVMKYGSSSAGVFVAERYRQNMRLHVDEHGDYRDQNGYLWAFQEGDTE